MAPKAPKLNELRNEIRDNLFVDAEVQAKVDQLIEVTENFTIRYTIRNDFAKGMGGRRGHAHFRDVTLQVAGTSYADPVDGSVVSYPIAPLLTPGQQVEKDVIFLAKMSLSPEPSEELYSNVKVEANFDIERFFNIVKRKAFETDIESWTGVSR